MPSQIKSASAGGEGRQGLDTGSSAQCIPGLPSGKNVTGRKRKNRNATLYGVSVRGISMRASCGRDRPMGQCYHCRRSLNLLGEENFLRFLAQLWGQLRGGIVATEGRIE